MKKNKTNHESTKFGKHEKGNGFLSTPPSSFVLSSLCVFGAPLGFILYSGFCILGFQLLTVHCLLLTGLV
jgi:hypothetical protein